MEFVLQQGWHFVEAGKRIYLGVVKQRTNWFYSTTWFVYTAIQYGWILIECGAQKDSKTIESVWYICHPVMISSPCNAVKYKWKNGISQLQSNSLEVGTSCDSHPPFPDKNIFRVAIGPNRAQVSFFSDPPCLYQNTSTIIWIYL